MISNPLAQTTMILFLRKLMENASEGTKNSCIKKTMTTYQRASLKFAGVDTDLVDTEPIILRVEQIKVAEWTSVP